MNGEYLMPDEDDTWEVPCSNPGCATVLVLTPDDDEWHQSLPLCDRCRELLVRLENGEMA